MNKTSPVIIWFRNDLRLSDNPALFHACETGKPIIPLFIYDPKAMDRDYGAASKLWLHYALSSLQKKFKDKNIDFIIRSGDSLTILNDIIQKSGADEIVWNRSYEKWSIERDTHIKQTLSNNNVNTQSFKATVIFEPWEVKNGSGEHYRVFTPFFKKCIERKAEILPALPSPSTFINGSNGLDSQNIDFLGFLPELDWDEGIKNQWDISEKGAWDRFHLFMKNGLSNYKGGRDLPSEDNTSKLSPYLRWGMISPREIYHAVSEYGLTHAIPEKHTMHFISEIFWREFSFHLLYFYPEMKSKSLQEKFTNFPWKYNELYLKAWQNGQTGYPLVDAGMRQLWRTGWMHNRVRMIVGSLLVKHLLQPWADGEAWFWDTLLDACPANNTAGWQWIGGCGADAAPYFRVFNPIIQGHKFDAYAYVREFVPEIAHLDDKYLFSPWESPVPPKAYPAPIISHEDGREQALAAFQELKNH